MFKRVLFGFGMAVLLGVETWAADVVYLNNVEALKGVNALTVDVSVQDGNADNGEAEARIRVDTELRLRKAGILVVASSSHVYPRSFLK